MTEPNLQLPVPIAPPAHLSPTDHMALEQVVRQLIDSRGLVVRVADLLGGLFGTALAAGWRSLKISPAITRQLQGIAETSIRRAFDVAILSRARTGWATGRTNGRLVAAATGAISGFAGIIGFLPDATATTLLIMRNIAAIATRNGEDLEEDDTRRACVEVFALGAAPFGEKSAEGERGYWSARLLMHGRPMSLLLTEVSATYGLRLAPRVAAAMVPVIGAASGALVNTTFLDHYRNVAEVHFTIRRLERQYGTAIVRTAADSIAASVRASRRPAPPVMVSA